MSILNQYQHSVHDNQVTKPFEFNNLSMLHNELTIEAIYQQYGRNTIRYSIEDNLAPLSYISDANGEISGYIHDIVKILALKTGLNFEYVYPNKRSVDEMLATGEIDFIPGELLSEKISKSTVKTQPFYTINWSHVRTTKAYQQHVVAILDRSGKAAKLGIFNFLNNPVIYTDFALLKNDIERGVITHAYIPRSIADDYLYYGNNSDFELVYGQKHQLQTLMGISLKKDATALRDMLNVAIAITTPNEISLAVQNHNTIQTEYVYGKKQARSTIIILLLFFAIVVIAGVLWNTKLKSYLQEARANGKKSHDQMQWLTSVLNSFPGMVLISDAKGVPLLSNKAYNDCFNSCVTNRCI